MKSPNSKKKIDFFFLLQLNVWALGCRVMYAHNLTLKDTVHIHWSKCKLSLSSSNIWFQENTYIVFLMGLRLPYWRGPVTARQTVYETTVLNKKVLQREQFILHDCSLNCANPAFVILYSLYDAIIPELKHFSLMWVNEFSSHFLLLCRLTLVLAAIFTAGMCSLYI